MKLLHYSLCRDKRGVSPAFSTMILTAGVIVMILVAMSYASNILNLKMAQNEFESNKGFMQTTGQQMDDIAWTIGRTQTVTYSTKFGALDVQEQAISYTIRVHNSSGWTELSVETGIVLFNLPVSAYSMNNGYFARVPFAADSSFLLAGSSAPVSQVLCEQKLPMNDGSYLRIVLVPTMRVLTSTIAGSQNLKFYLPSLHSGDSPYLTQSLTMTGEGITKIKCPDVDQVILTATFPQAALGFDSIFFNFNSTTITLDGTSTPSLNAHSVVEFYVGNVEVSIGAV